MKYLIFGDIHSEKLNELDRIIRLINPQIILSTGDIDNIATIHELMAIEKKYTQMGKEFIKVCGNHEYTIYHDDVDLRSEELDMLGKSSEQLHKELMKDSIAKKYIEELVSHQENIAGKMIYIDKSKYGYKYPALLVHGALKGNLDSYPECPIHIRNIWYRLEDNKDYKMNFDIMKNRGIKIMIKGNEHIPTIAYVKSDENNTMVTRQIARKETTYKLYENYSYIINPGSITQKVCAIIETDILKEKTPILSYMMF